MRTGRLWFGWLPALLGLLLSFGAQAYDCPKPTQQLTQDVSSDIRSEVSGLKGLAVAKFETTAATVTNDVFAKYKDAGSVALSHSMISIFCQIILPSTTLGDAEKLDRLYRLEELITRTSGQSVPMGRSAGTMCLTAPGAVLRPINALFDAWQKLDVDEYLAQWAPDAIARSQYYVMRSADLTSRRRADFANFASVTVRRIEPKILFADGTKARVSNVYTMHFVRRDGRVIDETNVGESYVLECDADKGVWRIRENNDYQFKG
jgi:ketosteroid isomerase-like protein